jgi:hypothetical protein
LLAINLAFVPFFGADLDLDFGELGRAMADLRGLLARAVLLGFDFEVTFSSTDLDFGELQFLFDSWCKRHNRLWMAVAHLGFLL